MLSNRIVGCAALMAVLVVGGCSSPSPSTGGQGDGASAVTEVDDPGWRIGSSAARDSGGIEGYADHVSVLPGEKVRLFVSSPTPTFRVTAYRMTGTSTSDAVRVWRSERLTGGKQKATSTDPDTGGISAAWKPSLTVSTEGWREGMYLFRLNSADGGASYVPLVVRSASTEGKVVIAFSVLTWQAYNAWGGKSAYKDEESGEFSGRSYSVSFDRPYDNGHGAGKYLSYEHPVLMRAERLGIPLAYETTLDVATQPGLLNGALGYVSLGHDEYWTGPQRDAVEKARDAGTNLAFLGANVSYWQVRLRNSKLGDNRVIDIYKSGEADPKSGADSTVLFRSIDRGENQMTGQYYECFPAKGQYTVLDPDFFLFEGTGATAGSTYDGVLSVEVDRAYPVSSTPRPLQVVAKSATQCNSIRTWSTSTYYTVDSGAGVFSAGTMGWVLRGLSSKASTKTSQFVGRVTDNLLRDMAEGPMGQRHPATDNLDDLGLSKEFTGT